MTRSIQALREKVSDNYLSISCELAKRGIPLDPENDSRTALITHRGEIRRLINTIRDEADRDLKSAGNDPVKIKSVEDKISMMTNLGDIVEIRNIELDLMNIRDGHRPGSSNSRDRGDMEGVFSSSDGRKIRVLGRNDSFAALDNRTGRSEFGFGEYIAAMVRGTGNAAVKNALAEGTDSAGGYTVPKVLLADVIDRMRAKTTVIQAGALTIPLESQTTTIARIAADPAAGWRLENAAVAESDPTFEGVTFTARSLAVLVKVSRELLDDSVNIDQALATAFAGAMAVECDRVALFGSGTAPEPLGIFNTTNVNSVSMGTNGAQISNHSKLLDCLYELQADNAATPTAQIMHPRTWRTIAGFADTTGQPLQAPQALATLPQLVSTTVPINQVQGTSGATCSSVIVGDFSQLLIGVRQELRIEVVRDLFAGNLQYGFIAHLRMDVAVAHPESFCKLIGILP